MSGARASVFQDSPDWLQLFRDAASDAWSQSMVSVSQERFLVEEHEINEAARQNGYSKMPAVVGGRVFFCRVLH